MKLPNVPRYNQHISQLCLRVKITACSAKPALASARSSMPNQAATALAAMKGTQMKPAFCNHIGPCAVACDVPPKAVKAPIADHDRHHKLHHGHAEVPEAGIQAQRVALARVRKEEADVGHRAGEVGAAEAAQQRQRDHPFVGRAGVPHREPEADRRQQQARRRQRREAPTADEGHGKGIEDPKRRAAQRRQRGQPEQLVGRIVEARRRQVHHHHRPHHPHREGQGQRRDRQPQVARGHPPARVVPEPAVFRVPVVDDRHGGHGVDRPVRGALRLVRGSSPRHCARR